MDAMRSFAIDYASVLKGIGNNQTLAVAAYLKTSLPPRWSRIYNTMAGRQTNIVQFTEHGNEYLFDFASGLIWTRQRPQPPADRLVAVYGFSRPPSGPRDASRMQGFVRGGMAVGGKPMDKGHAVSHAQGGGLDVNLFPQRPEVNRGRSEAGREYRKMEKYCAQHPGTFFFVRFIYGDQTWTPWALEYGVLRAPRDLWVQRFPN